MYCNNCGEQVKEGSKFCAKCGTQVEQQVTQQQAEQQNYTAPKPFQPYSSIDPNQGMVQKTAFKGKQVSVGSSGHVSFKKKDKKVSGTGTGKKKAGCLTWIIRLIVTGFILFALLVVYYMVTDDTAAQVGVDVENMYVVEMTDENKL